MINTFRAGKLKLVLILSLLTVFIAGAKKPSLTDLIHNDGFYGEAATEMFTHKADSLYNGLKNSKNPAQYIIDNDVVQFIADSKSELSTRQAEIPIVGQEFLNEAKISVANQGMLLNSVVETLQNQLNKREEAINRLSELVDSSHKEEERPGVTRDDIVNYCIIGAIILLLIGLIIFLMVRKGKAPGKEKAPARNTASTPANYGGASESADGGIVVRRRTTSILKKQWIDDAKDNPEYMLINSHDFCNDSAVRNIYIKNSCIKEVYDLYADDLRNSENPKEDGCMVLGRWVKDEGSQEYDITLEEVVFPGDDAVFKEYELNFGGKIKLRIAEKLRRLRKETNLQYDLVCWIHSHPGLGVFFSNSDTTVQAQLKHAQHPNFLIAFVVDILTSTQEMGIFTFRRDGVMNSKNDLTRLYSLEDMYKWALESEKNSFVAADYYNILKKASLKASSCEGVDLNNSSIIDLTRIVLDSGGGITGWALGSRVENQGKTEYVVKSIVNDNDKPTSGIVGCLISVTHMSFPSINRLVKDEIGSLNFVMVYSTKTLTLTTIPVVKGELVSDEQYYSDVNIEDLKIWTRRKR